jgi:maltose/moltooligosaccharide transporter
MKNKLVPSQPEESEQLRDRSANVSGAGRITPMRKKPLLSFWQLWNMSFGYVGIQFGFALQNANVSRIFETLGAKVDEIPILWIAGPVSGLLVQPVIGYMSDRTWNRLGRRKPYFLVGAVLASLALLVMPNSPGLWFAAGMLWIMDASINVTMEPMRAFVGDMLPDEQRTQGFAVQTFFIGASSVVGSLMPYLLTNWFHVSNTAPAGQLPASVKWSFYLGGVVYLLAVLWTIIARCGSIRPRSRRPSTGKRPTSRATPSPPSPWTPSAVLPERRPPDPRRLGVVSFVIGYLAWDKALYILSLGACFYGALEVVAARRYRPGSGGAWPSWSTTSTTCPGR